MTDVFLLRDFEEPLTDSAVLQMAAESGDCLGLYRVDWIRSALSADGRRMLCRFAAPDAESARNALRQAGEHVGVPWPGSVHDAPSTDAPNPAEANVVVERRFEEPVTLDEIQAIEDAGAWCLEAHDVVFAQTYFSLDRRCMVCLYQAPDAEAVRNAQRKAGMPVESVWSFRWVQP